MHATFIIIFSIDAFYKINDHGKCIVTHAFTTDDKGLFAMRKNPYQTQCIIFHQSIISYDQ